MQSMLIEELLDSSPFLQNPKPWSIEPLDSWAIRTGRVEGILGIMWEWGIVWDGRGLTFYFTIKKNFFFALGDISLYIFTLIKVLYKFYIIKYFNHTEKYRVIF